MVIGRRSFDAIVLGSGIAGLGAALGLVRRGRRVLVLNRKGVRGQATLRSAGILDPFLELGRKHPLLKLTLRAHRAYPALMKELGRRTGCPTGYEKTGLLYVALTPSEERELKRRIRWQAGLGVPIRWIDGETLRGTWPRLAKASRAALFYPTLGKVNPPKMRRALERDLRSRGVRFEEFSGRCRVLVRGGRVAGIRADGKMAASPVVINAAGCWSRGCVPSGVLAPVRPVRGQIVILKSRLKSREKIRTVLHDTHGAYLVPWGPGEYLAGSTVEFAGFNPSVTRAGISGILRGVTRLVPSISRWKVSRSWAGLRPFSRDRLPLVGKTPLSGFFLATGYYRSGILIAACCGELLAEQIVTGKTPAPIAPFSPLRLSRYQKRGERARG